MPAKNNQGFDAAAHGPSFIPVDVGHKVMSFVWLRAEQLRRKLQNTH
jgi:hypothetical protein